MEFFYTFPPAPSPTGHPLFEGVLGNASLRFGVCKAGVREMHARRVQTWMHTLDSSTVG